MALCVVIVFCLLLSTESVAKIDFFKKPNPMEYDEIKDRIAHIIRAKNMTAAEFAVKLGIQPSNISHLLSGRNNPSLDFVRKLKETFPEYSLDWIVFGKGPMTVSEPFPVSPPPAEPSSPRLAEKQADVFENSLFASPETPFVPEESSSLNRKPDLKKMILVYADHTFEVLLPR